VLVRFYRANKKIPDIYIYLLVTRLQEIYIGLDSFSGKAFERNRDRNLDGYGGYGDKTLIE